MISFFACLALLIIGFLTYSKVAEKVFGPDDRKTPALTMTDGSDYVPMGTLRIFLIQLLNIAGLGPIFGALAGACWGPSVFLWITLGTLLGGGIHDYMVGMMSMRHKGASVSELTGTYLGNTMKQVMRVFSVILLVLVGVAFSTGPANLLAMLTPDILDSRFWLAVVLIYYFIATFVPIDKVIGKIYPFFGICLIVMALGVGGAILLKGYYIPEITLSNLHPSETPIWPTMFISVACGAISGFHATQSPLMARCLTNEKDGRKVTLADWFQMDKKPVKNRLILTIPLLAVGSVLTQFDVQIVWRYFSWSNQTLAMIALWSASVYLFQRKRFYWITVIPATFMSAVSFTYILIAKEGFQLSTGIAYPAGFLFAAVCFGVFVYTCILGKGKDTSNVSEEEKATA